MDTDATDGDLDVVLATVHGAIPAILVHSLRTSHALSPAVDRDATLVTVDAVTVSYSCTTQGIQAFH